MRDKQEADLLRVDHILESIEAINSFEITSIEQLAKDVKLKWATVKNLEIIGEAANKISPETKEHFPEIPWPQIVGMRNTLIHEYFNIDLGQVWSTVKNDLDALQEQMTDVLNWLEEKYE